jgi:hypothetical protein
MADIEFLPASVYACNMARLKLEANATIADVAALLDKPVEYVRLALSNLHAFAKENNGAHLTIGVTGKGIAPHYKIGIPQELDLGLGEPIKFTSTPKIFDGRTHKELRDITADQIRGLHWSSRSTSLDELKQLLGKLRGLRPSK